MEEPLNIERNVVKNGVRLDCVFEGYEYRPERKKSEASGLPGLNVWRSQKTPGCLWNRSRITVGNWVCRKRGAASYSRRMGRGNGTVRFVDAFSCREGTVVGDGSVLLSAGRNITGSISLLGSRSVKTVEGVPCRR